MGREQVFLIVLAMLLPAALVPVYPATAAQYTFVREARLDVNYIIQFNVTTEMALFYGQQDHAVHKEDDFAQFVTPYPLSQISDLLYTLSNGSELVFVDMARKVARVATYKTPNMEYPVETFYNGYGDCDCYCYIVASILINKGVDCVLLHWPNAEHMTLGVYFPNDAGFTGEYVLSGGKRYWVVECTAIESIGYSGLLNGNSTALAVVKAIPIQGHDSGVTPFVIPAQLLNEYDWSPITNPLIMYLLVGGMMAFIFLGTITSAIVQHRKIKKAAAEAAKQPKPNLAETPTDQALLPEERQATEQETAAPTGTITQKRFEFCPECGEKLPVPTAKFCPFCGTSLKVQSETSAEKPSETKILNDRKSEISESKAPSKKDSTPKTLVKNVAKVAKHGWKFKTVITLLILIIVANGVYYFGVFKLTPALQPVQQIMDQIWSVPGLAQVHQGISWIVQGIQNLVAPISPARNLVGTWKTTFPVKFYIKTDFETFGELQDVGSENRTMTWIITATSDENVVNVEVHFTGSNLQLVTGSGYVPDVSPMFYIGRISGARLTLEIGDYESIGPKPTQIGFVGEFTFTSWCITGTWHDHWELVYAQEVYTATNSLILRLQ